MQKIDIKSQTLEELTKTVIGLNEPAFRAKQLFDWMHCKLVDSFDAMTNLSKTFREKLKENCSLTVLEAVKVLQSELDGSCKFLFRLPEDEIQLKNNVIESVLMKYHYGNSVCISSQVGCRMGCRFCASTLGGLERNLTAAEMLEQIYRIQQTTGERVNHVVVMGTGEPMDNLDSLLRFLKLLSDKDGLNISKRNVTISTCGLPEGIKRLADEGSECTLALSLHAPNDALRKTLMPVAYQITIQEALETTDYYFKKTGRRVSFEYSLIRGVNDAKEQAFELVKLLKGKNCHVNLIPINPIDEREYRASTAPNVLDFKNILEKNRINVTIRREIGSDISAACGQLRKSHAKDNEMERTGRGTEGVISYKMTDIGLVREMNQDLVWSSDEPVGILPNLYIVADGMGGHSAGDFASRFCVEEFVGRVRDGREKTPITQIERALIETNEQLILQAKGNASLDGMGTTFVVASVLEDTILIANIGDSRMYIIDTDIEQITMDHSLVAEMVRNGDINEEAARIHPNKNIVTRAISTNAVVLPDFFEIQRKPGSTILLCSDGLFSMLGDDEIAEIVKEYRITPEMACKQLVRRANENGGKDNISVILVYLNDTRMENEHD